MTAAEFSALDEGDCFERAGKIYTVLKTQGTHVISHLPNDPLHIHFLPHQASQMTKIASEPAKPVRPKSSHGFPALERSTPRMPRPHMSVEGAPCVCLAFDGGLAQSRRGNEIGPPIPEGLKFLTDATEAGIEVRICTHRSRDVVYEFLRIKAPGLEDIIQASPQPPPPGVLYISRHVFHVLDDVFPTVEELAELLQPSEGEKEPNTVATQWN